MKILISCFIAFVLFLSSSLAENIVIPEKALELLKEGNDRFVSSNSIFPNLTPSRRIETAKEGQFPFVAVLSCSDSRVPVDYIFDRGIGDIFNIKVAGNVAGIDEIGTLEYGIEHLNIPLIVILGHSKCGAVTEVVRHSALDGSMKLLAEKIIPSVEKAKQSMPGAQVEDLINVSIKQNIFQVIEDIFTNSQIVRKAVKEGKCKVLAAVYDIESGKVEWLGYHPDESKLLTMQSKPEEHIKKEIKVQQKNSIWNNIQKMFSFGKEGDGFFTIFFIIVCAALSGLIIFVTLYLKSRPKDKPIT